MGSDIITLIFLDILLLLFGIIMFTIGLIKYRKLLKKSEEQKYLFHAQMNYFGMMIGGAFDFIVAVIIFICKLIPSF